MIRFKEYTDMSESVKYHMENDIPLKENIYRMGSEKYLELFKEARKHYNEGNLEVDGWSEWFLKETELGETADFEGNVVPLDMPMVNEAEYQGKDVELNKPKAGGSKKYYVYVKNDKGNVVKVQWGDTTGLKIKLKDQGASKSFASRHNCAEKKDKTKPGYWACNMPKYAKQLGLEGNGWNGFW